MNRFPQDRGPLYTLDQVGERTGIHPMLLQSYLQTAAWRVPTVWVAGEERYPREALVAFRELHEEAQRASAPVAPPAGDGPSWGRRRLLSLTAQRRSAARTGNGNGRAAAAAEEAPVTAAAGAETAAAGSAAATAIAEPPASQPPGFEAPAAGEGSGAGEEARAEPRRAGRPLFTLQQVHEHTGIPYPVLALYAASEAGRIPAAGERYAPLYPWEALGVFCRIHHERNPSWQPPALPAEPPAPEEEAAARELSDRLERLERTQSQLAQQIRSLLDENDELYMTATVWA